MPGAEGDCFDGCVEGPFVSYCCGREVENGIARARDGEDGFAFWTFADIKGRGYVRFSAAWVEDAFRFEEEAVVVVATAGKHVPFW